MEQITNNTKPAIQYVKLKEINEFTVQEAKMFQWKRWNQEEGKMETATEWQEGFSKKYPLVTDKGMLELSQAQLGQMLAGVYLEGKANIINRTFTVKTNGKQGMEIRYFINPVYKQTVVQADTKVTEAADEVDASDLPF